MNKKITILFLILTIMISSAAIASANDLVSPVILTAEATTFNVNVPTNMVINVSSDGKVTTPTNLVITNNSYGPVKVESIQVSGKNSWEVTAFNTDMTREKVNAKKIGLKINNCVTNSSGVIDFKSAEFPVIYGKEPSAGVVDTLSISYDAVVPAQSNKLTNQEVVGVTFTIRWNE